MALDLDEQDLSTAIYHALVQTACRRVTTTYGELGGLLGVNPHFGLGRPLGRIWHWCHEKGIPHINALVVRQDTGRPGGGYEPDDWKAVRDAVWAHDYWPLPTTRP